MDKKDPAMGDMPLHLRILNDVEKRILSGEWPPGHRIPFEHELTVLYGCSRMTVNKALTDLAKKGLIERRRKAGSYVSFPHVQSAVMEIHDLRREVQALGLPYRYRIVSRKKRRFRREDHGRLALSPSASVLEVICDHFAGDRPFCHEERLINLAAVPEAADESFEEAPPGSWLLGKVPWSAAEHRIRAEPAKADIAAALAIPAGSACLVIERTTHSGSLQITHVKLTYPGDRHELVAQFAHS
jgi:GntR family histidine utilization transcriptional repressor